MISELLTGLTIPKVAAAAAAGAVALGGLGVAGAAMLDDRAEPARQDVPVLTEDEGVVHADGPATAAVASGEHSELSGTEVEENESGVEGADASGEAGPSAETHGTTVSDLARSGEADGATIAATASEGRSEARADNAQAPVERPTAPPADTPAAERPSDPPADAAEQGQDRRPDTSDAAQQGQDRRPAAGDDSQD
jgi:hypothetical protein